MKYALHFAVAALATAFACATPTEYRDGPMVRPAPVRPVPGYAPPGTGLPEYMPMPEPPAYPRSPYKRYLPPEPDGQPGIWAADEPKASADDAPLVMVLDVPLALPAFRDPELDIGVAHDCKNRIPRGFAADPELKTLIMRLSPEERMCWVATVMQFCAHLGLQSYINGLLAEGITLRPEDPHGRSLRGLFDGAKQLRDLMCPGLDDATMTALRRRWENLELGSPKGRN